MKLYHYGIAGRREKLVKLTGIKKSIISLTLSEKKIHGSTIAVVAYCNIAHMYILPSKIAFKRIYNVLLRHPPLQLSEM